VLIIANKHRKIEDEFNPSLLRRKGLMPKILSTIAFLGLMFIGVHSSYSQGKISLVILDSETHLPLPDAKVEIFNAGKLEKSAITSENGRITFDVSDTREMDLVISKAGYNKLLICEFQVKSNKKAEIYGSLSKGSALQYAKGSYLTKNKKKALKTSKRAFARF
jgi:hypothetical protein